MKLANYQEKMNEKGVNPRTHNAVFRDRLLNALGETETGALGKYLKEVETHANGKKIYLHIDDLAASMEGAAKDAETDAGLKTKNEEEEKKLLLKAKRCRSLKIYLHAVPKTFQKQIANSVRRYKA